MYCVTRWGRIPLAVLQPSTQTPSPKTDSISQKICLSYANPKSQNPGFCKTNESPNLLANPTKKCWRQKSPQYSNNPTPLCRVCCLLFVAPDGNSTFWEVTHLGSSLGALVFFQPWKSLGPWLPFFVVRLVACRVSPCFSVGVFHHPKEPPFF